MKKFSVLLRYPKSQETYLAWVKAATIRKAEHAAQVEAMRSQAPKARMPAKNFQILLSTEKWISNLHGGLIAPDKRKK